METTNKVSSCIVNGSIKIIQEFKAIMHHASSQHPPNQRNQVTSHLVRAPKVDVDQQMMRIEEVIVSLWSTLICQNLLLRGWTLLPLFSACKFAVFVSVLLGWGNQSCDDAQ